MKKKLYNLPVRPALPTPTGEQQGYDAPNVVLSATSTPVTPPQTNHSGEKVMQKQLQLESFFAENPVRPTTRSTYEFVLRRFAEEIRSPEVCTPAEILKFFKKANWGSSMCHTASVAIKKYLRWKYGALHPALLLRVKREESKPGRSLNAAQAGLLLESFDLATVKGRRDYAIACLALDTGLRVNELATLKLADIDFTARSLNVRIKGGAWDIAVFSEHTCSALVDWCNHRRLGDDRMFQVTRDGLRVIVRRWGEKIGIRLSPHDLRRSFATLSSRNGAPSRLVQIAGRWSDLKMVERYTQDLEPSDFDRYFPVAKIAG